MHDVCVIWNCNLLQPNTFLLLATQHATKPEVSHAADTDKLTRKRNFKITNCNKCRCSTYNTLSLYFSNMTFVGMHTNKSRMTITAKPSSVLWVAVSYTLIPRYSQRGQFYDVFCGSELSSRKLSNVTPYWKTLALLESNFHAQLLATQGAALFAESHTLHSSTTSQLIYKF